MFGGATCPLLTGIAINHKCRNVFYTQCSVEHTSRIVIFNPTSATGAPAETINTGTIISDNKNNVHDNI